MIDVALYESMFNLMEAVVPEYDGAGVIRGPSVTTVTSIVPTNTFRCQDGKYLIIGENGAMANNTGRVVHQLELRIPWSNRA